MKFRKVNEKRYKLIESDEYAFERYRAKADRMMERNYSEDFEMLKYHKWYLDFEPEYIFLYVTDYDTYVVVITGYDKTEEFDTQEEAEEYWDNFFKDDDEEINEDINSGYIQTHCPECFAKNRVFVKFPAFNKPFEDTQYTCDKCGCKALVKDNHKYNKDGTLRESVEPMNYKGYNIEASFYDKGDTNLYILKDNDFVTDESGKRKSFAWLGDAKKFIDTLVPTEEEVKGPSIEGKRIVNYLYFTGSKVTDVVKGKTEAEANSKFTSWIRSNTSYNSISQYDKHVGCFNGYETEDGTIYVLRNGDLCKNTEHVSWGGDSVPYSELKEGFFQNLRGAFRQLGRTECATFKTKEIALDWIKRNIKPEMQDKDYEPMYNKGAIFNPWYVAYSKKDLVTNSSTSTTQTSVQNKNDSDDTPPPKANDIEDRRDLRVDRVRLYASNELEKASKGENKSIKEASEKEYSYSNDIVDGVKFSIYEYTSGPKAGKVQISSLHPYDDAEYHWAVSKDSGKTFRIYINSPGQFVETFTNDSITYDKVMAKLNELDRAKKIKPRMVHN